MIIVYHNYDPMSIDFAKFFQKFFDLLKMYKRRTEMLLILLCGESVNFTIKRVGGSICQKCKLLQVAKPLLNL